MDNDTLKRILGNKDALAAVMNIEGFRALGDNIIETVINKSEMVKETKKIMGDDKLSPNEKAQRLMQLCASLAVNGLLLYVNVKGTKADLENLKLRPQHLGGEASIEQKLKQLGDEKF